MLDKTFAYLQVLTIDKNNPIRRDAEEEIRLFRSLPEVVLLQAGPRVSLEAHYAKKNEPDMSPPDKTWWHWTGVEWIPRYGAEMLGKDF